ncbi:MAG: sulfatase [Acidobacteria bacterium]|nr:sulfatase [Acidobacteriota bacterium]
MRDLGRALAVALWITAVLVAFDVLRIPAATLARDGALRYALEAARLGAIAYAPLFAVALLPVAAALRLLPSTLRRRHEESGFPLSLNVAVAITIAVLLLALAAMGEGRRAPRWWSTLWAVDAAVVAAGAAAAGWGAAVALRRIRGSRLGNAGVAVAALVPIVLPAIALAPAILGAPPAAAPPASRAPSPAPPDIVLIVADTLRPDALGCYGGRRAPTPVVDALAASGARFTDVTAQASWTNPSTATILTSWYPFEHGLLDYQSRISEEAKTLAEVLRARGYATEGLVANLVVSTRFGFDRGFDRWDQEPDLTPLARHAHLLPARLVRAAGRDPGVRTAPAADMVSRALDALSRPSDRPRFLYLHLMDPHDPYTPPPDLARAADPDYAGSLRFEMGTLYAILRGEIAVDDADLRHAHALYDAEIAAMDRELGRLLDRLRPGVDAGNTVVVFTSDHGEEFMEHGALGHEHTLYQELIHVPLIVVRAGVVEPGRVVASPARLLDVAPTILDVAGLGAEPSFHGSSRLGAIRGEPSPLPQTLFSQEDYFGYRTTSPRMRSARASGVKVILSEPNIFGIGAWRREAFDLAADPGETRALDPDDPRAAPVEAALRVWMGASARRRGATGEIDPETERRLRALGYIQ